MSKFSKALQQAEEELALRRRVLQEGRMNETASALVESREAPLLDAPPASEPPSPRVTEERPAGDRAEPLGHVDEHLVSLLAPTSLEAEQYRALRHLVEQLHKANGLSAVAVSSAGGGDGKTTTAINLAGALAQAPEGRVLLIDADLRRSSAMSYLGLDDPAGRGFVDAILHAGVSLEAVVQRCPQFNLAVLPAGSPPSAPYEVLKSPRLEHLLDEARRRYDYIVLDTPPLIPFPDCRLIGKYADGFLIVVQAHQTPRKLIGEALEVTDPTKIIGLVFNGDEHQRNGYYYSPSRSSASGRAAGRGGR